jgi:hypothetical protein
MGDPVAVTAPGLAISAISIGKIKPLFTPSPPPAAPLPPCRPSALRLPGAARGRLLGLGLLFQANEVIR